MPHVICGAARLRADVVLRQDPPGSQDQRETVRGALVGRHKLRDHEPAFAAHEAADVHDGRAFGRLVIAGPLHTAELVDFLVS